MIEVIYKLHRDIDKKEDIIVESTVYTNSLDKTIDNAYITSELDKKDNIVYYKNEVIYKESDKFKTAEFNTLYSIPDINYISNILATKNSNGIVLQKNIEVFDCNSKSDRITLTNNGFKLNFGRNDIEFSKFDRISYNKDKEKYYVFGGDEDYEMCITDISGTLIIDEKAKEKITIINKDGTSREVSYSNDTKSGTSTISKYLNTAIVEETSIRDVYKLLYDKFDVSTNRLSNLYLFHYESDDLDEEDKLVVTDIVFRSDSEDISTSKDVLSKAMFESHEFLHAFGEYVMSTIKPE